VRQAHRTITNCTADLGDRLSVQQNRPTDCINPFPVLVTPESPGFPDDPREVRVPYPSVRV